MFRQVVGPGDKGEFLTPLALSIVLECTTLDVSFLVGTAIKGFNYHHLLYHQRRRRTDSANRVSWSSLANRAGGAPICLREVLEALFAWGRSVCRRHDLLPSNPFAQALAYAGERESGCGCS